MVSFLPHKQLFLSDNVFSGAGAINCGFPQGSVLGILLFLLYINEIPQSLSISDEHKYVTEIKNIFKKYECVRMVLLIESCQFNFLKIKYNAGKIIWSKNSKFYCRAKKLLMSTCAYF